jgi:hypothetical protein
MVATEGFPGVVPFRATDSGEGHPDRVPMRARVMTIDCNSCFLAFACGQNEILH